MDLPDWIPKEEWEAYLSMRKQMGKKHQATEYAQKLLVKRLDEFRVQGMDVKKILEQSIMRSWVGVFPVQPDRKLQPQDAPRLDSIDRTRNLIEEYDRPSSRGSTGYEAFKAATQNLKH